MAITDVGICNSALAKVGAQRILSLNDNSVPAKVCKEQYEKVRDELLYSHPWNFAMGRATLAPSVTPPVFDWSNQFPLPTDALRVVGSDLPRGEKWRVEGRMFMANTDAVSILFIRKVTDASQFTPGFAEVLASKLASDICYSLVQSVQLKATLEEEYERKLRTARSYDAQESMGDRVYADSWLNARA